MKSCARSRKHLSVDLLLLLALCTLLAGSACQQPQSTADSRTITVARCVGYCNLALFVASDRPTASRRDLKINLKYIANPGDHPIALAAPGGPSASVTPFTNVAAGFANDNKVRIIAGSGMNGLALISQPEVATLRDLAGKTIGTFRADTLEVFAYDAVQSVGLERSVRFVYFADALEPLSALKNGEVDAITHVEPFVSNLVQDNNMNLLIRGEQLWNGNHPDCVLVSTTEQIDRNRSNLKDLILQMMMAQRQIENDLPSVAQRFAEPFYQMPPADLIAAAREQFPQIDIRDEREFIIQKSSLLVDRGYIAAAPGEQLFDFSLLQEVITENPSLWESLGHRAGGL